MNIYKISAIQGSISFKSTIYANSFQDARNKLVIQNSKNNMSFPYVQPEVVIESIFRRYNV